MPRKRSKLPMMARWSMKGRARVDSAGNVFRVQALGYLNATQFEDRRIPPAAATFSDLMILASILAS